VARGSGGSGGDMVVVEVISSSFLCIFPEVVFTFSDIIACFFSRIQT
jgi:hypothetical protein